jgi:uncharacterized protein (UPF0332 family)
VTEESDRQIRALQEKARQALSDAELLLDNGSVEAAINRGYYSAFQAARAALLTEEEGLKTHSGVIRRFGYHFVRTGRVSDEIGDILATAQSMRERADYDAIADLNQEDAAYLVDDARRFIRIVETQILPGQ